MERPLESRYAFPFGDDAAKHGDLGMSLRAYIATKAMQGMLACPLTEDGAEYVPHLVAQHAVKFADTLILELNKDETQPH